MHSKVDDSTGRGSRRLSGALSAADARRLALAAQGFGEPRAGAPDRRALLRVVRRVGAVQLDSVTALVRAHYLPLFSRLGAYDTGLLDDAWQRAPRRLFEYWAHEACLVPIGRHHLFRWRMARAAGSPDRQARAVLERRPELARRLLERIREEGAATAAQLAQPGERGAGGWWGWSDTKGVLEWLLAAGELACARRRGFERVYDLTERVVPREALERATPPADEAQRELVRIAARACGVAAEPDLREYFRLPATDVRARVRELVESGELEPVAVEGWGARPGYLVRGARVPEQLDACALIGPFDSLLWGRPRLPRVHGFDYGIEMYKPAATRRYGYYVLPLLLGDRLVARVDLRADRGRSALVVAAVHTEPSAPDATVDALRHELEGLARWLALETISWEDTRSSG